MRVWNGQIPCSLRSNVIPAVLAICCRVPAGGPQSGGANATHDQLGLAQKQIRTRWHRTTRSNV
jgi:hypothetical protein